MAMCELWFDIFHLASSAWGPERLQIRLRREIEWSSRETTELMSSSQPNSLTAQVTFF